MALRVDWDPGRMGSPPPSTQRDPSTLARLEAVGGHQPVQITTSFPPTIDNERIRPPSQGGLMIQEAYPKISGSLMGQDLPPPCYTSSPDGNPSERPSIGRLKGASLESQSNSQKALHWDGQGRNTCEYIREDAVQPSIPTRRTQTLGLRRVLTAEEEAPYKAWIQLQGLKMTPVMEHHLYTGARSMFQPMINYLPYLGGGEAGVKWQATRQTDNTAGSTPSSSCETIQQQWEQLCPKVIRRPPKTASDAEMAHYHYHHVDLWTTLLKKLPGDDKLGKGMVLDRERKEELRELLVQQYEQSTRKATLILKKAHRWYLLQERFEPRILYSTQSTWEYFIAERLADWSFALWLDFIRYFKRDLVWKVGNPRALFQPQTLVPSGLRGISQANWPSGPNTAPLPPSPSAQTEDEESGKWDEELPADISARFGDDYQGSGVSCWAMAPNQTGGIPNPEPTWLDGGMDGFNNDFKIS